ncbi:phosphatase PAP2 family protein [Streptomyces rhizosphaerihabitans]|uniref:phosphatase PAP2 family protein n=1 Tax=Streptomyces rhizosphaerihabitans TaxID=1266770 RepID=UPI0021C0FC52|nr:phosphatase PAP2 family protein [Streptomyces rhizosphaerihabitans]MCT9009711.1 phosphatase PAP2 family protein [Streptomyces rhizosphaerihabitans]
MGDTGPRLPRPRPGRALAHTPGASGSGSPHRSDSRPPQTPRGARQPGPDGRLGTTPPVPGRPTLLLPLPPPGPFFSPMRQAGGAATASDDGTLSPMPRMPLLFGLPALCFVLITWQVVAGGPLVSLDERISAVLVHPDRFSELLADLGSVQVAVPVLAVTLMYIAWRGRATGLDRWWQPPAAAAVLMALVPAVIVPLKELIARPGPPVMGPGTGFYPSGHTATAAIAYGAATLLLLPLLRTAGARGALLSVCAAVNACVAFGLVRRGYHWPLDVVASWCLCAVLLCSLRLFVSRSTRRSCARTPSLRTGPS